MLRSFSSVSNIHKSRSTFLRNATPLMQSLRNNLFSQLETYTRSYPILSSLPLLSIMKKTWIHSSAFNSHDNNNHINDQNHLIINYLSSMTWSLDFFLSQFNSNESSSNEPSNRIQAMFKESSINFDAIKSHAMAVVGSGWTWLLIDNANKMIVTNTFNGDVPLFGNVMNYKSDMSTKNGTNNSTPTNTLLSLLTRSVTPNGLTASTNSNQQDESKKEAQIKYTPLIVINMWEHAWIPDYAVNKGAYIKDCWERINWQRVEALLP